MFIGFIIFAIVVLAFAGGAIAFAIEHPVATAVIVLAASGIVLVWRTETVANRSAASPQTLAEHQAVDSLVDDPVLEACDVLAPEPAVGSRDCPLEATAETKASRTESGFEYATTVTLTNRAPSTGIILTMQTPWLTESPEVSQITYDVPQATCAGVEYASSGQHRLVLQAGESATCSYRTTTYGTARSGYLYQRVDEQPTSLELTLGWQIERLRTARYHYRSWTETTWAWGSVRNTGLPLDSK